MSLTSTETIPKTNDRNRLAPDDRAVHDWYRFILSFPPHLVREYLQRFGIGPDQRVLDPFCGTGTTLVECKKLGIPSIGIEANPMAHFASSVKTDWTPSSDELLAHANWIATSTSEELEATVPDEALPLFAAPGISEGCALKRLAPDTERLLLANSISPKPLHKTLMLLEHIDRYRDRRFYRHERLALAKALVTTISNLEFGPEVGVGPAKADAPVVAPWYSLVSAMTADLRVCANGAHVSVKVCPHDARVPHEVIPAKSIDAVITSPPYPNEKDYTRTTRLESVLLGFISSKTELQQLKRGLVRSNTRSVYRNDDDDQWAASYPEIQRIAEEIEARRVELGKTSGFERMYPRVTRLYFGGMARHLANLRSILRPDAKLAYVVGDQASYLRVMIRTGQLLAQIADSLGYEVVGIDLFRTRLATATKEQLREEVVVLRWPG